MKPLPKFARYPATWVVSSAATENPCNEQLPKSASQRPRLAMPFSTPKLPSNNLAPWQSCPKSSECILYDWVPGRPSADPVQTGNGLWVVETFQSPWLTWIIRFGTWGFPSAPERPKQKSSWRGANCAKLSFVAEAFPSQDSPHHKSLACHASKPSMEYPGPPQQWLLPYVDLAARSPESQANLSWEDPPQAPLEALETSGLGLGTAGIRWCHLWPCQSKIW